MGSFFHEFWLHPKGAINRHQYRLFLLIYFFILLPLLTALYLAVIVIGFRTPSGILRESFTLKSYVVTTVYVILVSWPFVVASIKRMHDLGYSGRKKFFHWNPVQSARTGYDLVMKIGSDKSDDLTNY